MKGLKKNSVRTRKRVIAILLSVLMVLSIVIPSGGSGVRYNAFAEGEESAVGEGVDLTSEEGTAEEEVTSEEMTEETMEPDSDISSEETTETDENAGNDEVSPVTTEQGEEDELFEDENLLLGSGNTSDDELFEGDSLLGEGATATTGTISFYNLSPNDNIPDESATTGAQNQLRLSLGRASTDQSTDFEFYIDITDDIFDFSNFDTSGNYTFSPSQGSQTLITCKLTRNDDGTVRISISGIQPGDTQTVDLKCTLKNDSVVGDKVTIKVTDSQNDNLSDGTSITHYPGQNEKITISNSKSVNEESFQITSNDGSKLTKDLVYTVKSTVTIPKSWSEHAGVHTISVTDTITFGNGVIVNASDWETFKSHISSSGGLLSVSDSDMTPIYSSDNSKITGISIVHNLTESETDSVIGTAVENGNNLVYTTPESTLTISQGAPMSLEAGVSTTILNVYDTTVTSDYNPNEIYPSDGSKRAVTNCDDGSRTVEIEKKVGQRIGDLPNSNGSYDVRTGNIVKFDISAKNVSVTNQDITLVEEMEPGLRLATKDELTALGISEEPFVFNGHTYTNSDATYKYEKSTTTSEQGAVLAGQGYNTTGFIRYTFTAQDVTAGSTVSGYVYCYIEQENSNTNTGDNLLANYLKDASGESNYDSSAVTMIEDAPDPTITKTVSPSDGQVKEGDIVTYTITIDNNGYKEDSSLKVEDIFPSEVLDVQSIMVNGTMVDNSTINDGWTVSIKGKKDSDYAPVTIIVNAKVKTGLTEFTSATNTAKLPNYNKQDFAKIYNYDLDNLNIGINKKVENINTPDKNSGDDTSAIKGEIVKYTVTVTNKSDIDIDLSKYTGNDIFKIGDDMPEGISYVTGSAQYKFKNYDFKEITSGFSVSDSDGSFEWKYSGESSDAIWNKDTSIILTFNAEVTADGTSSGTNIVNKAYTIDKTSGPSDTATVTVTEASKIKLDKYITKIYNNNMTSVIWDSDTEGVNYVEDSSTADKKYQITMNNIPVGSIIEYSVKVSNESESSITDIKLDDVYNYNAYLRPNDGNLANSDWNEYVKVYSSSGNKIGTVKCGAGFDTIEISDNSSKYTNESNGSFVLASGDYLILKYELQTTDNASNYTEITNTIQDANDSSNKSTISTKNYPVTDISKSIAVVPRTVTNNNQANTAVDGVTYSALSEISDSKKDDYYIVYRLRVAVDSTSSLSSGFKIEDTIDNRLKFVTSAENEFGNQVDGLPIINVYRYAWGSYAKLHSGLSRNESGSQYNATINGKTIVIESSDFVFDSSIKYVDFFILTEIDTDNISSSDGDIVIPNTSTTSFNFDSIKEDGTFVPENDIVQSNKADLNYSEGKINPSFSKTGIGAFNNRDINSNGIVDISDDPDISDLAQSPSAGDKIIWKVYLKNLDKADSKEMKNFIITDTLPNPYTFDTSYKDGSTVKYYPTIIMYNSDGSVKSKFGGNNNDSGFIEPNVTSGAGANGEDVVKWDFRNNDNIVLQPGEYMEIQFASKVRAGGTNYADLYINKASVEFVGEDVTVDSSAEGYKDGDSTVNNEGEFNIGGYSTTSHKNIQYTHNDKVGSPETDIGRGKTSKNYVKGLIDDDVTYTLYVQNTSTISINNLCIIDRMPNVGDIGIIDGTTRKSAFGVEYAGDVVASYFDNSENTTSTINLKSIYFAAEKATPVTIPDGSKDWIDTTGTVYDWHSSYQEGDSLIRFEFEDDLTLDVDDHVEIQFIGHIPYDTAAFGEENIAWNNFGYSYHPVGTGEAASVMKSAEPPKVGVWVEQLDINAVFEAEKMVDGEIPESGQIFNFAVDEIVPKADGDYSTYTNLSGGFSTTGLNFGKKISFDDKAAYTAGNTAGDITHYYRIYESSTSDDYDIDSTYYIARVIVTTAQDGTVTLSDSKAEIIAKYVKNNLGAYVAEYNNVDSDNGNDATIKAVFNNKNKTGSVKILKKVTFNGEAAANYSSQSFDITLSLSSNASQTYHYKKNDETTLNEISFTDGKADISLKDNEYITITDLPIGITVTAAEKGDSFKSIFANYTYADSSKTTDEATVSDNSVGEITIKNTYTQDKGNLTITKKKASGSENFPAGKTFPVSVLFKSDVNVSVKVGSGTAGDNSFSANTAQIFDIAENESIEITGIPAGTEYEISEVLNDTDYLGFAVPEIKYGNSSKTISKDKTDTVEVLNKYTEVTGSLIIHKSTSGRNWADVKDYISFTVTGPNSYSNTIEGNATGWTGTGNDVTYTLSGLELGTYTVTENISNSTDTEKDYYTLVTKAAATSNPTAEASSISDIELASSAKDKAAYFVNSYTRKTGEFTVTKALTGTNADSSKTFPIVIKLTYPSVGDISGSYTVAGGASQSISGSNKVVELIVNLAKDKSAVFTGIPYGTTFEVSETISDADASAGYTKTSIVPNESKTMDDTTKDTTVTVTNNYDQGKGSIVIYKTLSGDNNINWDNVKNNISFTISDGTPENDKTVLGTAEGWNYNEATKVATYTYNNLELGTYTVTEVLDTTTGALATNYNVTTKAGASANPTADGTEVSSIVLNTSSRAGKAYFTNKYARKTGGFKVEKTGSYSGTATEFEANKSFSITVNFTFPEGVAATGSYTTTDNSTATAITGNSVTFSLKASQNAKFTGIPYGTTYTVTEADLSTDLLDAGYLKDGIVYGGSSTLTKGTITSETANIDVEVKNKRVLPVKGYIEITKTASGDRGWNDIKDYISFSITSDGFTKTIRGTDPEWSVTGNVAKYQLTELDLDKTYKVEEIINGDTKASYYRLTQTAGKTDTELATGTEVSSIELTDTSKSGSAYFENNYTRRTGSLKLEKAFDSAVTDYPADYKDEMFTVTVTLKDENNNALTGNVTYDGVTFSNGSAEVQISANQSKTISGIPYGYSFSVTENQPTAAGYRILTGYGTVSGTIDADTPAPIAKVTNTYSPTTGSLRIIKSFGANSALTAGDITSGQITFDVSGTSATNYHEVYDFKDDFTGDKLTILSLVPDTYTVTERSTIDGSEYILETTVRVGTDADTTDKRIASQVSAGNVTEVTFTNTYTRVENAKLKITKKVKGLPDSIKADKEFKLVIEYQAYGSTTTKYVAKDTASTSGYSIVTTEPTGDAVPNVKAGTPLVITNLPYGTYNVKEKTDSASIDVDYYTFKLSDSTVTGEQVLDSNVQKEVALTNTYEENRTVGFNKLDLTSGTALPLNGASFELYKGADLISRVVPSNGTFYVNGLKANVTYTLREVSAPDGYTTVKDITFVIDEDNKVTVTPGKAGEATATGDIINVYDKKTSVKISKVDITNEKELPGATIQILDKDGNVVTDENGDKLEWTSTSTPKEIVGLKTGVTYTLRETVAPDGYQLTTDTVFKLNKDGSLDGTATTTTVSNEGVLLVEDAPLGAFAVNKKGYYNELCSDGANATIPLEGVKFTLTKKDDATFGQTKETDKDGIAAFTGLQPGTYELKETQTIEGYILDESVYTIKINADGSNDGLKDASGKAVEGNIITNDVPRTNLQLVKVNLSNKNVKLPGSTYGLFRKSLGIGTDTGKGTNEDGQLVKIAESVTDKDGILSFKGVLTGVDYTVQELAAPNGFYVSEQPITISFKTDEKGNVVIDKVSDGNGTIVLSATGEITWLEPQIKVSFTKQDMNGKNLAGAKLKVVDSNGNDVISWTSTTEAYVVEGTFTAGESYKLVEVEAPEGYEIAEPVEFTIAEKAGANGADVISVIMKDKEKTTTTVTPPEKTTPPSVKTGDSAPVKPVTVMMFISLAGIVFLLILGRRRKELFK